MLMWLLVCWIYLAAIPCRALLTSYAEYNKCWFYSCYSRSSFRQYLLVLIKISIHVCIEIIVLLSYMHTLLRIFVRCSRNMLLFARGVDCV